MNNRILLVDDEEDILVSLKRNLSKYFQIETAQSGSEAIEILKTSAPFACIVSDFNMPKMNGVEFFSEAKKIIPATLRIMLTGHADLNVAMEAINQDYIFRFLTKPVATEILIKNLKDAVEYHRLQTIEKEIIDMKSNFISIVSHEYKNPIAFLMTSTYLLPEFFKSQDQSKFDEYMSKMQISLDGMNKLLDKILTIGRFDSNLKLTFVEFDLVQAMKEMIKDFKAINFGVHNFYLEHTTDEIFITTDETILKLIMRNLITNAMKYSPKHSVITIRLINNIDSFILSVEDHGIGIPENEIIHLFDPFFRCTNVGKEKGTGLGLSIVNKGVELLNGKISVDSLIGKGSTFSIQLNSYQKI